MNERTAGFSEQQHEADESRDKPNLEQISIQNAAIQSREVTYNENSC